LCLSVVPRQKKNGGLLVYLRQLFQIAYLLVRFGALDLEFWMLDNSMYTGVLPEN
jgi:hypothetical protein